jgi:hypothetical protein
VWQLARVLARQRGQLDRPAARPRPLDARAQNAGPADNGQTARHASGRAKEMTSGCEDDLWGVMTDVWASP